MKRFIAIFITIVLIAVAAVPVFAHGDDKQEKSPYEKMVEFYNAEVAAYSEALGLYNSAEEQTDEDLESLQSRYECLVNVFNSLISYRAALELEVRSSYDSAVEKYNAKKEAYDNFDWSSYNEKVKEYEEKYLEYVKLEDSTRRNIRHKSEYGRRTLFYSNYLPNESTNDLSKIKGKTYSNKTNNIDMGGGVTLVFSDNEIIIEFNGTEKGYGIYDIYFESDAVVYHMLIDVKNAGTFVIPVKDKKGVELNIDSMVVNQDTQTKLNNPPKSPTSPESPGSMPSMSDFGGFGYPSYPPAP